MDGNYSIDDLRVLMGKLEQRVKRLENIQRPEVYQEVSNSVIPDGLPAPRTRSQIRSMLESESRKKEKSTNA